MLACSATNLKKPAAMDSESKKRVIEVDVACETIKMLKNHSRRPTASSLDITSTLGGGRGKD